MQRMVSSLPEIIRSTSGVVSSSGIGQGLFWMLRTWQPCSKSPSMHWKTIVSGHHSVWRLGSDASSQTTSSGASMKACCRQLIVTHRYYGGLASLDQASGRVGLAPILRADVARRPFVQRMTIYGVSFDMVGKQPIVLLKTVDGNKFLPIWIGHPEAAAILMKLQGAS